MVELIKTAVHRSQTRSYQYGETIHVCQVDHRYGPNNSLRYVVPLCGAPPGRAESPHTWSKPCQRKACVEAREKIDG